MDDKRVRLCQNCHGNKTVYVEVKPGKWEWQKCSACKGTGRSNIGTV